MKFLDVPSSGSYREKTYARNRFGQYVRNRATPVNPSSTFQGAVRSRLAAQASAWRDLTDLQRAGWEALGNLISRTDALGQSYTLNGFMAYVMVNNNNAAAGNAVVTSAPAILTPDAPVLGAVTLTAAAFTIAYTPTPAAAGQRIFTFASPQRSAGRSFEADRRLIAVSAAAAASPVNCFSAYEARFGVPVVGMKVFFGIALYDSGFLSIPTLGSAVVS